MGRPTDWSPLALTNDPVPGDPVRVRQEAAHLAGMANQITQEISALRKIASAPEGELKGQYASKIRSAASDVASKLGDVEGRFQKVSSALGQWVTDLEQAQAQSVQALDQAEGPYGQMRSLQAQTVPSGSNLTAQQHQQVQSHNTAVQRAQGELDAAKALLARAVSFRDSQASRYAAIINKAIDDRVKDSWWQSHVLDSGLMQWVDQHADTLSKIADVLGWIATAVAILALFIPGLNILAFALLGALLLIHTLLAVDGKGSWLSVGLDVLSIVTLGMGMWAARGLVAAKDVAQGALEGGSTELGSAAWRAAASDSKAVMSAAGKVFANDALRGTADWSAAQADMSAAVKGLWAAKNAAISDASDLAGAAGKIGKAGEIFKPSVVESYLSGGEEAAKIQQFFVKAGARFSDFQPLTKAIAQGMSKFNLGQRLFLGTSATDYLNHIMGGSPVVGWSGVSWFNNATTYAFGSGW
jgi:hypothetical protein